MLRFDANFKPCKSSKKVTINKCTQITFGLVLIIISCSRSVDQQENFFQSTEEEGVSADSIQQNRGCLSLNELLFDPVPESCDYVEIVNRSASLVDLAQVCICNRNSKGVLSTAKVLSRNPYFLNPGQYCLLTSDIQSLSQEFALDSGLIYLIIKSMPSMPNDKGCVLLLDLEGNILDECPYTQYMHHVLISKREGIALEKIHPDLSSAEPQSWTSASADVGYGTPGRLNSQYRSLLPSDTAEGFYAENTLIYPYGNTKHKVLVLNYVFSDQRVANIHIYNRNGTLIYTLAQNALLGARGCFVWQGTDAQGQVPDAGSYLIHTEHFNMAGACKKQDIVCRILP